jgi:hypothetical protein
MAPQEPPRTRQTLAEVLERPSTVAPTSVPMYNPRQGEGPHGTIRAAAPQPMNGLAGLYTPGAAAQNVPSGRRSEEHPSTAERPSMTHRVTASVDRPMQPANAPKPVAAPSAPKIKPSRSTLFSAFSGGNKAQGDGPAKQNMLEKAAANMIKRMRTTSGGGHTPALSAMLKSLDPAVSSSENLSSKS